MPILTSLVSNLETAQQIRPPKKRMQEEKEPFGPASRDYFWIICRLIEAITRNDAVKTWEVCRASAASCTTLNLNSLLQKVAQMILNRSFLETRHNTVEDDGLIGLLSLATALVKHHPPFRLSPEGQVCV